MTASYPAVLSPMKRTCSSRNSVHEPVVKSCNRVPTASTTSASAARALADVHPVTPIGPAFNGCVASRLALPATVSTTGMLCCSAKAASAPSANE